MAATIKRSIVLALEGGNVTIQEFRKVGDEAERSLDRVNKSAANTNRALGETGQAAEGMSRQTRAGLANAGNQLQDIIVQVQGGQGWVRALSQQLPQVLAGMGGLAPLLGAVVAIGIPAGAALFSLSQAAGASAKEATDAAKAVDELEKTLNITNSSVGLYAAGLSSVNQTQREMVGLSIDEAIRKQGKAYEDATAAIDAFIGKRTQATQGGQPTSPFMAGLPTTQPGQASLITGEVGGVPAPLLERPGATPSLVTGDIGGVPAPIEEAQSVEPQVEQLEALAAAQEKVAQRYAEFQAAPTAGIKSLFDAIVELGHAQNLSEEQSQAQATSLTALVTAASEQAEAQKLMNARHQEFLALSGQVPGALTAEVRSILDHAAAVTAAGAALQKYDLDARRAQADVTANLIKGSGQPDANVIAERYLAEQRSALAREQQQIQRDATKNAITEGLHVDDAEAARFLRLFDDASHKTGTLKEQIEQVREAGKLAGKPAPEVEQAVQTLTRQWQQTETAARKAAEVAKLVKLGYSPEEAQSLLSANSQLNAGLQGRALLEAKIHDQEVVAAQFPTRRAQAESEIKNLREQIAKLDEQDATSLQKQADSNKKVLDGLDAQIAKLRTRDDPHAAVTAAGQAAADRITIPDDADLRKPGGQERKEAAERERELARSKGEDAEATRQLNAEEQKAASLLSSLATPQEKYAQQLTEINRLYDEGALGIKGSNDALEARNKLLDDATAKLQKAERAQENMVASALGGSRAQEIQVRNQIEALEEIKRQRPGIEGVDEAIGKLQTRLKAIQGDFGANLQVAGTTAWDTIKSSALDFGEALSGRLVGAFDQVNDVAIDFLTGQEDAFDNAQKAAAGFARDIAKIALQYAEVKLVTMGIDFIAGLGAGAATGGGATGGTTGGGPQSLFPAGLYHLGGEVGLHPGPSRTVPAWLFLGAPRYHEGTVVGDEPTRPGAGRGGVPRLASDERAAILLTGEKVLNREQTRRYDAVMNAMERMPPGVRNILSGRDPTRAQQIVLATPIGVAGASVASGGRERASPAAAARGDLPAPNPGLNRALGLGPDERAAVLLTGERVLDRERSRQYEAMERTVQLFSNARRFHAGGGFDLGGGVPSTAMMRSAPGSSRPAGSEGGTTLVQQNFTHAPTYKFEGFHDPTMISQVVDMAASKSHSDLMRTMRQKPNERRSLGR